MVLENLNRANIKKNARKNIKGNILSLFASNLLVQILVASSAFTYNIPVVTILILMLTSVFEFGLSLFYLEFSENGMLNYRHLLISYQGGFKRFLQHLITFIIKNIIILISATLLLIPGLIKRYSYSQVKYIRASHPDLGIIKSILLSKRVMRWHKFELFILDLTFVIWFLLVPLTGGLILLYLLPYYSTTMANYHLYIKSLYDLNKEINKGFIGYFVNYLIKMN